jgi:predicted AlkP superfamily phosphohydrolase/phosphomutase
VVSDHGFGPQRRTLFVNSWLERAGLLRWREGQAPETPGAASLGLNQLSRHVYQLDWNHTSAYAPLPSGNGIHIVRAGGDHPGGVAAGDYQRFRTELANRLLAIRDPETGEPVVEHVWTREELFDGPNLALAPDLTLELADGGLVSILASSEPVRGRPVPTGTHRPNGIFVAVGDEYRKGVRLERLSILDVAPLVLHALRVPIPESLEGRITPDVFDPAALAARPPRRESAAVRPTSFSDVELDAEAEAEIIERLQALGYVE